MKYLPLLFLLCVGCSTIRQKRLMRHAIIYTVFDSAEQYFVHEIQEHAPEKPIGVIIDPLDPYYDIRYKNLKLSDSACYGMAVVFRLGDYFIQDEILEKSNRYMKVGEYLLPVYIMYVDDAFVSVYIKGKLYRGFAGDSTIHKYQMPYPGIYAQDFIPVNITGKTISGAY